MIKVRDYCFFNSMFSDSQAKRFVGKKWQVILPVTKFFTDDFLSTKFYADFFSSVKVNCFGQINNFSHFSLNEVFFYLGDALLIIGPGSILDGELFNTKLLQRLLQSVPFYMFAVVQDTHLVDVSTNNFAFAKLPGRYLLVQSQQWKHQHNVKPVQSWQ